MDGPDDKKAGQGPENSFKAFRGAGPLLGSGVQLAAAVVLFFFAGRWLDDSLGTAPWLTLVCSLAGAGGGLYTFIKTALEIGQQATGKKENDED